MKAKHLNLALVLATILVLTPTIHVALAQTASTLWISAGIYPSPYSFTLWNEGSYYYGKNAYGQQPSWSGSTNGSYVIQSSIAD